MGIYHNCAMQSVPGNHLWYLVGLHTVVFWVSGVEFVPRIFASCLYNSTGLHLGNYTKFYDLDRNLKQKNVSSKDLKLTKSIFLNKSLFVFVLLQQLHCMFVLESQADLLTD